MGELNREVGGLRCRDVLEHLSAYVDQELPPDRVRQVEAHLRGCDRCERFGGEFSRMVTALRQELGRPEALAPAVAARLHDRLVML